MLDIANYIILTCNEVTTLEYQAQINIHALSCAHLLRYREPLLVYPERLTKRANDAPYHMPCGCSIGSYGGYIYIERERESLQK